MDITTRYRANHTSNLAIVDLFSHKPNALSAFLQYPSPQNHSSRDISTHKRTRPQLRRKDTL